MNQIIAITMPKWGLEMTEGTIAAWHITEGTKANKGAELVDIETAKIVNTLELDDESTLRRLTAKVGDTLPVGALLAVLADDAVTDLEVTDFIQNFVSPDIDGPKPDAPLSDPPKILEAEIRATPLAKRVADDQSIDLNMVKGTGHNGKISQSDVTNAVAMKAPSVEVSNGTVFATPVALRIANALHIRLAEVAGTGRNGRITQDDVENFAITNKLMKPASPIAPIADTAIAEPQFKTVAFSSMRKATAAAVLQAKQTIPHFYLTMDVVMDKLLALRADLNAKPRLERKLTVNDFMMRATCLTLVQVPEVNVHYTNEGIEQFSQVNLGVAVAIDAGLIVPVIANAANKTIHVLSEHAADLAARARDRSLARQDLTGGTFTISNLGMFGIRHFEAIINPPQAGILAVGGLRREPQETSGGLIFASVLSVTLSCDHRIIDGAIAARFLQAFKAYIEDPLSLIL